MYQRKQQLLKKHRRQKRLLIVSFLLLIIVAAIFWQWWAFPLGLFVLWLLHEAWLADHLFYAATEDYLYQFPANP